MTYDQALESLEITASGGHRGAELEAVAVILKHHIEQEKALKATIDGLLEQLKNRPHDRIYGSSKEKKGWDLR